MTTLIEISKKWVSEWVKIGLRNHWIKEAYDPFFTEKSIKICESEEELIKFLESGNWCLGQGFSLGEICFINQIEGGDEFLVIKQDAAFESFSAQHMIKDGSFLTNLHAIQKASIEKCTTLDYIESTESMI